MMYKENTLPAQVKSTKINYSISHEPWPKEEAKKLIIEGAFRPVIDRIPLEELKQIIDSEIGEETSKCINSI